MLQVIVERDEQLLEQLSRMNSNMQRILQESQSQHRETLAAMLTVVTHLGMNVSGSAPDKPQAVVIRSQIPVAPQAVQLDEQTYQNPSNRKISRKGVARRVPATEQTPLASIATPLANHGRDYFASEEKSNSSPRNYSSGDSVHSRQLPNQDHYQASYTEFSDEGEWYGHGGRYTKIISPRKNTEQPLRRINSKDSGKQLNRFQSIRPTQYTELTSVGGLKLAACDSRHQVIFPKSESDGGIQKTLRLPSQPKNKKNQLEQVQREIRGKIAFCQRIEAERQNVSEQRRLQSREVQKALLTQRIDAIDLERKKAVEAMQNLTRKREAIITSQEENKSQHDHRQKPTKDKALGVVTEEVSEKKQSRTQPTKLPIQMQAPPAPRGRDRRNLFLDIPLINQQTQESIASNPAIASVPKINFHTDTHLTVPGETPQVQRDFESQPNLEIAELPHPAQSPFFKHEKPPEQHPVELHVRASPSNGREEYIIVTKPSSADHDKQQSPQLKKGNSLMPGQLGNGFLTPRVHPTETTYTIPQKDLFHKPHQVAHVHEKPNLQTNPSRQSYNRQELHRPGSKNESHPSMSFPTRLALVQFQEKQLIVDIQPIVEAVRKDKPLNTGLATLSISKWVAEVYDTLSKQTFSGYFSRHLSEPDAKVFFTHNLALNFEHMIEYFWVNHKQLWLEVKDTLIRHFETQSSNTLEFMMVKYPQKRKTYISEEIRNAIPVKNESEDPQFDVIRNTGNYFEYDPTKKSYCKRVKILLNRLMTQSQKHLPEFRKLMKGIFTVQRGGFDYELKNLIGMKFKENSPLYTKKEIEEEGIQIKAPQILRIIIKWIEELERKVRNLGGGFSIHNSFTVKKDGSSDHLSKFMKEDLKNFMAKKMVLLDQAEDEMRLRIRSVLSLFPEYLDKYMNNFAYIKPTEVKSGLLSFVLSETASNLSINYLIFIIDLLEEGSLKTKRFDGKGQIRVNDSTGNSFMENVEYKDFEFVTFTISDLLRCKCSGTLLEIKQVWTRLNNHPRFRVYRVKNRLDTSNRDFLVNARLKDTPILCEIQLSITDKSVDEKETYLNHFSHFIYELSRASYGPIAEAVIINSYLTQFVSFFRESLGRITENRKPLKDLHVECSESGIMSIEGHVQRNNNFTFVCSNCLELRIANTRHLFNFDSSHSILAHDEQIQHTDKIKHIICGDCAFSNLSPTQQSAYLLRTPLSFFFVSANQELEVDYPIVCAVQRSTSSKKIVVLQRCEQDKSVIYVPVFYECQTDKIRVPLKSLKQKYYVFKLKPQLTVTCIDTKRFVGEIFKDKQTFEILETVIESILSPMGRRAEDQAEQRFLTEYKDRQVVFSVEQMNVEELLKLNCEKLQVSMSLDFNYMLVLNAHHSSEELAKIIKKGRQLKEVDINVMMKTSVWKLENSNLDNESFEIPLFNQDINHIVEIKANENNFTKLHFMSSQTLRRLDLSRNAIRKLQLEERDFPSLEMLDLSNNQVDLVSNVHHYTLKNLLMGGNRIVKLHEDNWRLPSLEHLQLSDNSVKSLNVGKMKCPKLRELDAWQNRMQVFELPIAMYFLESLNLNDNCLRELDFSHVRFSSLKKLLLARNQLSRIKLPNALEILQELSLSANLLGKIELSHVRMPSIKVLDLSHNELEFPDIPEELDTLEVLNLSYNCIRHLCISKTMLKSLRDLSVENNPLEDAYLPQRLLKLESITLAHCQLTSIDFTLCSTPRLKSLSLQHNKLSSLRLPNNLTVLEELCIQNNNISILELSNIDLPELRVLDISHNHIAELTLPNNLNKLQKLNVSRNRLPALDISALKLGSLQEINIGFNMLERVELAADMPNLERAYFNHNRLTQLNLEALDLKLLKHLNISTNMLEMILLKENFAFSRLESIDSRYNPFISPIPSNVLIVRGEKFPMLNDVQVGVGDPNLTALWLIWSSDPHERSQLYENITRLNIRPINTVLVEETLQVPWEDNDLTSEQRNELVRILEYLRDTQAIPEIYRNQVRSLLYQSQLEK